MASRAQQLTPRLYVVLALLVMVGPLSTSLYVPGLPNLADSLDVTTAQAQFTISASLLGLALGQLVLGSLSDRWGRRRPVLIGMSVFVLASVLCAVAPSFAALLVARFVQGFAGASGAVVARATVRDLVSGAAAAQALSRLLMVTGVAPVIGPVIGGQVLRFADWRSLFVVLAVAGAISLVVAVVWFPETLPRERRLTGPRRAQWSATRALLRDRHMLGYMAIIGLLGVVTFSWMAAGPFYFESEYGMSAQVFAAVIGVASIAFVVGALVNSRVVMGFGPRKALVRGLVLMTLTAAGVLVAGLMHLPVWWVVAFGVLNMGVYGGMGANAQALALTPHGAIAGTVSALLGMMQFLGGAFGPPLVTWLVGGTWSMAVGMTVASLGALAVLLLVVRPAHPAGMAPREATSVEAPTPRRPHD